MNKKIDDTSFYDLRLIDLKKKLVETSKEDLVSLLLELSQNYESVNFDLQLKYANEKELLDICLNIMNKYVNEQMEDGIIKRKNIKTAITGAEQVFSHIVKQEKEGKLTSAINLSMGLLSVFIPLLDVSQDEDNIISYLIDQIISLTRSCAKQATLEKYNKTPKTEIYNIIIDEVTYKYYYKWIDWRCELLDCCILFCDDEDIRNSLILRLEEFIMIGQDNKWHKLLVEKDLKQLIFKIKSQYISTDEAVKYAEINQEYSCFRKIAIEAALENKEYEKVVYLAKKEVKTIGVDITNRVQDCLYQAYEGLGDKENQRIMAENFLLLGNLDYYSDFKKLSSEKQWSKTFDLILELFFEEEAYSHNYIKLLLLEKKYDKLFEVAKNKDEVLIENIELLFTQDEEKAINLLEDYLERKENNIQDQSDFNDIILIIRSFYLLNNIKRVKELLKKFKETYSKNIAFLEMLHQLKKELLVITTDNSSLEEGMKNPANSVIEASMEEGLNETDKNTKGGRVINLPFK